MLAAEVPVIVPVLPHSAPCCVLETMTRSEQDFPEQFHHSRGKVEASTLDGSV